MDTPSNQNDKMSKFKYSSDERDINKILKMNQKEAEALLKNKELSNSRKQADECIASSMELLKRLGHKKHIQELSDEIAQRDYKLEHRPKLEKWEDIVALANEYEPNPVVLEDIMTQEEIQAAFEEADTINEEFSRKTSIINKTDLSFLAIAIALQVAKSLIFPFVAEKFGYSESFNPEERLSHNDKSIEEVHKKANDEFKEEKLKKHKPGRWINILYQSVPYDITSGSPELGINMGGRYHRLYTLGHDPILGWLFGTANILTDCITFNDFQTHRVSRNPKMRITPEVVFIGTMFRECYEEIKADDLNLPAALFAQAQHLKSDEFTKLGLPVPILETINEEFASKLYRENYDALCFARDIKIIGVSFVVSKLIDIIISLVHGFFRKDNESKDLFEVRTRKILLISNSIASTSTIINAIATENSKNLDIGSLLNTISRLFFDIRFITKIKQEFINNEISNRIMREINEIDKLYDTI